MDKPAWISPFWQAAILPDKWDVGGVIVPPLSVWHIYALRQVRNGYVCRANGCDRDDAASLLLIASRSYADGKRLFVDEQARKSALVRIVKQTKRTKWADLDAACSDYVANCTRYAERWEKSEAGKPAGVHEAWHLVRLLSGNDPAKVASAFDTAYSVACCLYDATAEANGDRSIMYDKAQEMHDNQDWYVKTYGWVVNK